MLTRRCMTSSYPLLHGLRAQGAILFLSLAAGCSAGDDRELAAQSQPLAAEWSYVSDTVVAALSASPAMEGATWNVTQDNHFEPGWVVQTPVQPLWGRNVAE